MRLSLLIAVALLFGSVLASPTPMDPDPEDPYGPVIPSRSERKTRRKSSTPPDQGGSQGSSQGSHPSQSSESTDAGFGFSGDNKGFGSVKTQYIHPHYMNAPRPGKRERKANNLDSTHPNVVWGQDKGNPDNVMISPISHNFRDNPGIHDPQPAADYGIHGPGVDNSLVHTGPPFSTARDHVKMFDPEAGGAMSMGKHDRNRLIRHAAEAQRQMSITAAKGRGSRRSPAPDSGRQGSSSRRRGSRSRSPSNSRRRGSRSRSPSGGGGRSQHQSSSGGPRLVRPSPFGGPQSMHHPLGGPQSMHHPLGGPQSMHHPSGGPQSMHHPSGGPQFMHHPSGGPQSMHHPLPFGAPQPPHLGGQPTHPYQHAYGGQQPPHLGGPPPQPYQHTYGGPPPPHYPPAGGSQHPSTFPPQHPPAFPPGHPHGRGY